MLPRVILLGLLTCIFSCNVCTGAEQFFQLYSGVNAWGRTAFRLRKPTSVEVCAQTCIDKGEACSSFVYSRATRYCYGRKNAHRNDRKHWHRNRRYDYYERLPENEQPRITSLEKLPNSAGSEISFVRRRPRPDRIPPRNVINRYTTATTTTTTTLRTTTTSARPILLLTRPIQVSNNPRQPCDRPIGMQDGTITSDQLSASSSFWRFTPDNGRLVSGSGWMAASTTRGEYIEINFREPKDIVAVATHGSTYLFSSEYVKSYKVKFLLHPGGIFETYKESGKVRVFDGNTDSSSIVKNRLVSSVRAYKIQFHPETFNNNIMMQVEVYEAC